MGIVKVAVIIVIVFIVLIVIVEKPKYVVKVNYLDNGRVCDRKVEDFFLLKEALKLLKEYKWEELDEDIYVSHIDKNGELRLVYSMSVDGSVLVGDILSQLEREDIDKVMGTSYSKNN